LSRGKIWLYTGNIAAISLRTKDFADSVFRNRKAKVFRNFLKYYSTSKGSTGSNKIEKLKFD
jgi:hypothetical protein